MLFQAQGGLQVQVLETLAALDRQGCDARLIDPQRERLTDFDLVHVFSVINGNHRMVEWASSQGMPVVLSPLLRPNWTKAFSRRAALADWLVGRMTRWEVKSEYRQMRSGIRLATRCVALGGIEKRCLADAFGVPADRCDVVPNGIPARFFDADPGPFLEAHGLAPGFVLCAASVNPHKNQLGLARALSGSSTPVVLVGQCHAADRGYLDEVLKHRNVRYAGSLPYDSPLLASAYAAAGVFCLPSMSEVMPLTVLESLAAGVPAVMTRHHCMDLDGMRHFVDEVEPTSAAALKSALQRRLSQPRAAADCKRAVQHLTWDAVATQLLDTYRMAMKATGSAPRAPAIRPPPAVASRTGNPPEPAESLPRHAGR
jgi:hypothetical protein